MPGGPPFEVEESREGAWIRLTLKGDLDLATASAVRERLRQLKTASTQVRLDLSQLDFIDSSGVHVIVDAISDSRQDKWRVELDQNISAHAKRFLELMKAAGWDIDFY